MKSKFSIPLTLVFLLIFVIYAYLNIEDFKVLTDVKPTILVPISLLNILTIYINGLFIKIILKHYDRKIGVLESFYVSILSTVGNYFGPLLGGFGVRAVYLKKKYNFSYTDFISTLSGNYIIVFLMQSFIALGTLSYLFFHKKTSSPSVFLIFATIFSFNLIFIFFSKQIENLIKKINFLKFHSIKNITNNIFIGWREISRNYRLLLELSILTALNIAILLLLTFFNFKAINIPLEIPSLILYSAISGLSIFVSITPGALGIKESMLIFMRDILNISTDEILQVAVIDRGIVFLTLFFMFLIVKIINFIRQNESQ